MKKPHFHRIALDQYRRRVVWACDAPTICGTVSGLGDNPRDAWVDAQFHAYCLGAVISAKAQQEPKAA